MKPAIKVLLIALALLVIFSVTRVVAYRTPPPPFVGQVGDAARNWPYPIDARERCWLRLARSERPVIRVNCFAIDGVLYTHSSRIVPLASLFGKSWTQTVAVEPRLEVLIENSIYALRAVPVEDEHRRRQILAARHYDYIPDSIVVYALAPRQQQP